MQVAVSGGGTSTTTDHDAASLVTQMTALTPMKAANVVAAGGSAQTQITNFRASGGGSNNLKTASN